MLLRERRWYDNEPLSALSNQNCAWNNYSRGIKWNKKLRWFKMLFPRGIYCWMPNFWCCWKVFKSNKNTTPSGSHENCACSHVEPSSTFLPSLVTRALGAAKFRVFLSTRTRCMEIFTAHQAPQVLRQTEWWISCHTFCKLRVPVALKWHQNCLFQVGVKIKCFLSSWVYLTPKNINLWSNSNESS